MSTLINEIIDKHDPNFSVMLESRLSKAAPRLREAEQEMVKFILVGTECKMGFDNALKEILSAAASIQDFEIASFPIYESAVSDEPDSVIKWDRDALIRDRFGYLTLLADNGLDGHV